MHLRDLVVLLLINMRSGEVKVIKVIERRKGTGIQPLDIHRDLSLPLPAAGLPSRPLYTSALEDSAFPFSSHTFSMG